MDVVFKELGRLDETGNFGVLLTIIFVYVLYFLAIVLAKRADRKDQDKVKITNLKTVAYIVVKKVLHSGRIPFSQSGFFDRKLDFPFHLGANQS